MDEVCATKTHVPAVHWQINIKECKTLLEHEAWSMSVICLSLWIFCWVNFLLFILIIKKCWVRKYVFVFRNASG